MEEDDKEYKEEDASNTDVNFMGFGMPKESITSTLDYIKI